MTTLERSAASVSFAIAATIVIACGGSDDTSVALGGADGGVSDGSFVSDGGEIGDGDTPGDDAGDITDGGANFGEGGSGDAGDFPDGGTCNRVDMGDSFMSDCAAVNPIDFGGALVAGTYKLTKVSDIGSFNFCQKTFAAVPFQGGLVVGPGVASGSSTIDLALDGNAGGRKSFSWTVLPASTNKSPLAVTQSCPSSATFSLPYNSNGGIGKQTLEIVAPYGSSGGTATYHFEKD